MKKIYPLIGFYVFVLLVVVVLRVMGYVSTDVYDVVLKWLNLGVLVYLIFTFGRIPIKNFLNSQKEDLAREIEQIKRKNPTSIKNYRSSKRHRRKPKAFF